MACIIMIYSFFINLIYVQFKELLDFVFVLWLVCYPLEIFWLDWLTGIYIGQLINFGFSVLGTSNRLIELKNNNFSEFFTQLNTFDILPNPCIHQNLMYAMN